MADRQRSGAPPKVNEAQREQLRAWASTEALTARDLVSRVKEEFDIAIHPNTLGTMLNDAQTGQAVGSRAWWWYVPPGLMVALLGTGLSLINFAIDEIVDPKLRLAPKAARQQRRATKAGKGVAGDGAFA